MSRLVVVSNRVAPIVEGKAAAGGLAVAVLAALKEEGGIWFGWSPKCSCNSRVAPSIERCSTAASKISPTFALSISA